VKAAVERLEKVLDRIGRILLIWWAWPTVLVLIGAIALGLSWVCYPVGNDVHVFGMDLMGECEFRELYGEPCASCGMTRSWVHMSRGHLLTALRYNIAGASLWLILVSGGLVGVARLLTRRADLLKLHWATFGTLITTWVVMYCATWFLRLWGWYPLQ